MNDPLRKCPMCATPVAEANLGLRDYRWVTSKLPGRVGPMDVDFVLEKNGHILILEFKPAGMAIGVGQRITLTAFAKMGCDVWVVRGDGPYVTRDILTPVGTERYRATLTVEEMAAEITDWFADASVRGEGSAWN